MYKAEWGNRGSSWCEAKWVKGKVHSVRLSRERGEFVVQGQAGEGESSWWEAKQGKVVVNFPR